MTTTLPTPVKGKSDWRIYRAFQLENGVSCLVINDKESKTTAMSCCVNVGASADPRSLSGLAHFCEHMCFLGSEKYPGENEYKRYLSSHGGRSNASTNLYLTNYKFEVLSDHAEKAIDIFSNFFVSPLFTSSGTSREVQAVDSEHSKNLTADGKRRLHILKDLADQSHYYSKFTCGNSETLNTNDDEKLAWVREALLTFHRLHYKPENMTVVVAGPQSLDTLEEWIMSRFSAIEKKEFPESKEDMTPIEILISEAAEQAPPFAYHEPEPPFNSAFKPSIQGSWPVLLTTKPMKSMRKLVMMFPMPSDRKVPDRSPSSVLSHLLGHEGPGSPFAVLQNHGMLSSLSAGARTRAADFNLFQVDMGLTEKGEKYWQQVVDVVFAYCRLISDTALKSKEGDSSELQRIWGEVAALDAMFFNQTSPSGAYSYAPNLAERFTSYGAEACLKAGSMLSENEDTFPLEEVLETSQLLVPDNCMIEWCSRAAWEHAEKEAQVNEAGYGKKTEQWYGIDYYLSPIDSNAVRAWEGTKGTLKASIDSALLSLPRPNRYIPRTLDLCPDLPPEAKLGPRIEKEIDPPNLLVDDDDKGRLFHRLDDRYALPQSSLTLLIRNAAVQNIKVKDAWHYDGKSALLSSILSGAFNEAMAQETYDAELAGLYWSVSLGVSGIKLSCFGFSDRLPDLALKLLGEFLSGQFMKESYFDSTKDRVLRGLRTYFESRRADSIAIYYRDALLASKDNGISESLALAESTTFDSLQAHHNRLVLNDQFSVECLFTGNVSDSEAKDFFSKANKSIDDARSAAGAEKSRDSKARIAAGFLERRMFPGEDIELHFASENLEEENGAVVFTYQSSIPAFKGDRISHPLSLKNTSAVRLICQLLREPLFDDLRTKQQLGYVVSSYYEVGYSSRHSENVYLGPLTQPVDFITINVLSRKLPPPEVANRINVFLNEFRQTLQKMPESEIKDHADALRTKLLKPIQKLDAEASSHYGKIMRYGPEVFAHGDKVEDIPWNSAKALAESIQSLQRADILEVWDRMMQPHSRSRIVSCVYGKTYPLSSNVSTHWSIWNRKSKIVNNFDGVINLRKGLEPFDDKPSRKRWMVPRLWNPTIAISSSRTLAMLGIGMLGAGVLGWSLVTRNKKLTLKR